MIKRMLFCTMLVSCAISNVSNAEQADRVKRPQLVEKIGQKVTIPGTHYAIAFGAATPQPNGESPSPALMKAIATWLSINFKLPALHTYPAVKLESTAKITTFRYTGLPSDKPEDLKRVPPGQREVVAAYDALTNTIYLPRGWAGSTPAELSVLVHEMVHHLQQVARIKYECTQASEELAYAAQEKWLGLFGRNLATDFEIDPFTLLVSTRCPY